MPEISPLIRLFVSSTFADFTFEREVLQRAVLPRLRALCTAQGCRFQPIDLRWGVSEEAGNEKRTLAICLDEIARCQRLSPDLNFLILLGDRYGSCFLPERIPSDQVARLLPHLAPAERDAFAQAYKEDLNALRPEHVLLPSDGAGDARQAEESLRAALAQAAQAAGFSEQELLSFVASATHLEIQRGLLDAGCDPSATICAIRSIESIEFMPEGAQAAQYVEQGPERRAQMEALKAAVEQRLIGRVSRYSAPGQITGPRMGQAARARYKALAEQFYALLEPRIQEALALRQSAAQTRDSGAEANRQFAESRATVVVGRDEALDTIATYLDGQTPLPLVVTGESGVGKSTLLARAMEEAASKHPSAVIITRYVGVTPGTSSLADLLSGLRREIAESYGQPAPDPLVELSQLVAAFAQQLGALETSAERPLFLVIDALDQLSAESQRADWLPRTLGPHVRVVLSTLSDRQELASLRAWLPETQLLRLNPLTRAQGADVLRAWLAVEGRILTSEQETAVLEGFAPAPEGRGTPLYLRLAFEQARTWRSLDRVDPLPPTITTLIQNYFGNLEDPGRHGRELVAYALGDIAAAKHGLAEDELLDVLSRSAAVHDALRRLSPGSPPVKAQRPLPVALWARLAADLERYLTEREADGARLVTFYHRQVREEVVRRYLRGTEDVTRHADLAAYFGRQSYNPGEDVAGLWNQRKLAELAYQQEMAGATMREALGTTLTDGRFLEGKLTVEGVSATLDDLAFAKDNADIAKIGTAIRAGSVVLTRQPSELPNQIIGRVGYVARLHHLPNRATPWLRLRTQSLPALVNILQGHLDWAKVNSCALSAYGHLALSASDDCTLRLWSTHDGRLLHVLEGHAGAVNGCALTADGRLALSASEDQTLRLWDTSSGRVLRILQGHSDSVNSCALSADGRLAVSASTDESLRVWDLTIGQTLRILEDNRGPVKRCALSADGQLALSVSWDMRTWDTASGQMLRTLEGHLGDVTDCALSADGLLALSSSDDRTLRLWDTSSGAVRRILQGHTYEVTNCALNSDGSLALSASSNFYYSNDRALWLWDTDSGEVLQALHGHTNRASACALDSDGKLALTASIGGTLRLWALANAQTPLVVDRPMDRHKGAVHTCDISSDGKVALSGSEDSTLRLWDTTTGMALHSFEGHRHVVYACALSGDGRLALSASSDKTLRLWDAISGQSLRMLPGHFDEVRGCALNLDGSLALSASLDKTLCLWHTSTGGVIRIFGYTSEVYRCALNADGHIGISCGPSPLVTVWDTASGQAVQTLKGHLGQASDCALSANGVLALTASEDRTLRLWDTSNGDTLRILEGHEESIWRCALSADGSRALSASLDQTLRLWDTISGRQIACWTHDSFLESCALSSDGKLAVTCDTIGGVHFLEVVGLGENEALSAKVLPLSQVRETRGHKFGFLSQLLDQGGQRNKKK